MTLNDYKPNQKNDTWNPKKVVACHGTFGASTGADTKLCLCENLHSEVGKFSVKGGPFWKTLVIPQKNNPRDAISFVIISRIQKTTAIKWSPEFHAQVWFRREKLWFYNKPSMALRHCVSGMLGHPQHVGSTWPNARMNRNLSTVNGWGMGMPIMNYDSPQYQYTYE